MFGPARELSRSDFPAGSRVPAADWHILAGFWHPVAFASAVGEKPVAARLLDTDIVLYRTKAGVSAAQDICIHRGAKLSLGWVDDACEHLVCPMHGLHYNAAGQCTRIPSAPDPTRVSERFRLRSLRVAERYGLIFVCLKETPIHPLPDWPLIEDHGPEWQVYEVPPGRWQASASRHTENFNDVAHLSWVHMKTFGNRNRPFIPPHEVDETEAGLHMSLPIIEVERGFNDDLGERERETIATYDLTYPFASRLKIDYDTGDGGFMTTYIYDIASPVSERETAIFQINQTNIPGMTRERHVEYQLVTNEEDAAVVESQRPEAVPLDLSAEVHIPADRFSVQYRRGLRTRFGLGAAAFVA
jgi:phenylpropionate dioxygenase-like ring-hydroxylating dioxygenase large terminal subunit